LSVPAKSAEQKDTERRQQEAADPRASAWVSANAGTGKTHVLTLRALRLMLSGTIPERILCLTYTKAAAAEMSKRVYDRLAGWVTMEKVPLAAALEDLENRPPTDEELERARTLFTMAIETPGGLKVQTIHSFCERLLQRFPLEAGVAPGFSILDDATAHLLQREAIDNVLAAATRNPSSAEGGALAHAIRYAADERFDDMLRAALQQRRWLEEALRLDLEGDALRVAEKLYRDALGVSGDADEESLTHALASVLREAELLRLRDALSAGGAADQKLAANLANALAAQSDAARAAALEKFFCTAEGAPRARLLTQRLTGEHPDLEAIATAAQGRFGRLINERKALTVVTATMALHRLAGAVLQGYTQAKARRAALDYEDLIVKSVALLRDRQSAAWVLYKLDRGIDHILVDEAQDTSREQWQVVAALAEEFFTGSGQREETTRTLFAVGDEKQSIYSFQGAAPRMFAEMGRRFAELTQTTGQPWRRIPLDLSFRTVAPILDAVDRVFADAARTPGLTADASAVVRHAVHRLGHGGLVEVWPVMGNEDADPADVWTPLAEGTSAAPQVQLADRIAETIKGWLENGEQLAAEGRAVRPGDILILVRKRRPFAGTMVAALKARGIPVAGADRLRLAEQIAVQDLISLGNFLTLPEDDLSLAEVLKSPLIGFDDDDLMALAPERRGTLWKALIDAAKSNDRFAQAAETLKRWRARADYVPPFEFFAAILDREGMRAKFLARLGPEAADPLDEFLNLALAYDDAAAPSLTGFLAYLGEMEREVKRDMEHGRDEVRVMTVHGAKGLEAPVVFLPDTCSTAGPLGTLLQLDDMHLPLGVEAAPFVWPVKGTSKLPAIANARQKQKALQAEERNRLLYVAMTRARDRLYVAGFEGKQKRPSDCWYDIISKGLRGTLCDGTHADGGPVQRRLEAQTAPPTRPRHELAEAFAAVPLPEWALRGAPREPALSIPLAPSRLEAYAPDTDGEPLPGQPTAPAHTEPAVLAPGSVTPAGGDRFLRGTLTHALLQHLPTLPHSGWRSAAEGYIAARGDGLSAGAQKNLIEETLAILHDPQFASLFVHRSRAEVPIVALLPNPDPRRPPVKLIGQIDRLVEDGNDVLIVDYKTNRPPPERVEDVAKAYLFQLAAYRLALAEIYPGRPLKAALLWTAVPRIMQLPGDLLDEYAGRLFDLDLTHLDAHEGHS
jgi:ATP-dependent helicase/nuclease subunit A